MRRLRRRYLRGMGSFPPPRLLADMPTEIDLTDDESLLDQTGTQVTRSDLIAHWGMSFS